MHRFIAVLLLLTVLDGIAVGAKKETGTTALKDVQPAGTTDGKDKKHQQYDFIFDGGGNHYTCRTSPKASVNPTDFVVGLDVQYEINGDAAKLKSMAGKQAKCNIVRVERISAGAPCLSKV